MTQEQYDTMALFAQQFSEMRKSYNDQQLLDWCQVVMAICVEDMKDGPFEQAPPSEEGSEEPPTGLTMGQKMALLAVPQPPSA